MKLSAKRASALACFLLTLAMSNVTAQAQVADRWSEVNYWGDCEAVTSVDVEHYDCARTVLKRQVEDLFRLAGRLLPALVGDRVDHEYLVRLLGMGEDELRAELSYEISDVTQQIALVRWQYPDLVIAAFRANERYHAKLALADEPDELFAEVGAFRERLLGLNQFFNRSFEMHLESVDQEVGFGAAFSPHPAIGSGE